MRLRLEREGDEGREAAEGKGEGTRKRRVVGAEGFRDEERRGRYETPRRREDAGTPGEGSGGKGKARTRATRGSPRGFERRTRRGRCATADVQFFTTRGECYITRKRSRTNRAEDARRDCPFETALSRLSRVSSAQFRRGVVRYFHTKVSYFTSPERGASFIRRERPILRPPLPPRRHRRRGGSR